jgi:Fe-S cluster biogenesis protein NfuA
MAQPDEVIAEVIGLLEPMVVQDGGSLRVAQFSAEGSTLVVDYARGVNEACESCVIDGESLKEFIDEGLQTRGVHLSQITVSESAARARGRAWLRSSSSTSSQQRSATGAGGAGRTSGAR